MKSSEDLNQPESKNIMAAEKELIRMLDEKSIEISIPNKLGHERIAMACSASFAKIVGFRPERIED